MIITAKAVKALLIALLMIIGFIVVLVVAFQLIILILPAIAIIAVVHYLSRMHNKMKEEDIKRYKEIKLKLK